MLRMAGFAGKGQMCCKRGMGGDSYQVHRLALCETYYIVEREINAEILY